MHGRVILYDAHSIRSHVQRLFDGDLPQFNIGTNGGTTCAGDLEAAVTALCAASGPRHVANGRFKGGWTNRHYGRPDRGDRKRVVEGKRGQGRVDQGGTRIITKKKQ